MSKELEALKKIEFAEDDKERSDLFFTYAPEIEEALHRLESINNANSSEALECLENIRKDIYDYYNEYLDDISIIKQALLKAQEQEKVLEILFEKKVNIYFISTISTYDEYLNSNAHFQPNVVDYMGEYHKEQVLTKEEFDLLCEVLCDE